MMNSNYRALAGAKWVGSKPMISNPMSLDKYI